MPLGFDDGLSANDHIEQHVAGIGFTPGRPAQQQRHLAVDRGMFGEIVDDEQRVAPAVAEVVLLALEERLHELPRHQLHVVAKREELTAHDGRRRRPPYPPGKAAC